MPSLNKCDQKCTKDASASDGYTCDCFNPQFYTLQGGNTCQKTAKTCNCPAPSFCVKDENDCKCKGVNGEALDTIKDDDGKSTGCDPNGKLGTLNNVRKLYYLIFKQ